MIRVALAIAAALLAATAAGKAPGYAERAEVKDFIRQVAARHGFAEQELVSLFSRVRRADPVLDAIKPVPPKVRSWQEYRGLFVNEPRIAGGVEFWKRHRAAVSYTHLTLPTILLV